MTKKLTVLETRFHRKKEQLLEKDLILEEVSALAERLKHQATSGREDTTHLARRITEYQNNIKAFNRRMMASLSELSMYQAIALQLEDEKAALQDIVETVVQRHSRTMYSNWIFILLFNLVMIAGEEKSSPEQGSNTGCRSAVEKSSTSGDGFKS